MLFLEAGDDLNLVPTEIKRMLLGLETGGELRVSRSEYLRHKTPRYGTRNPERMDFPFWKDMIRTGGNAYSARTMFNDKDHDASYEPERNTICIAGGEVHVVDEDGEPRLVPNEQRFELDVARFQWRRMK